MSQSLVLPQCASGILAHNPLNDPPDSFYVHEYVLLSQSFLTTWDFLPALLHGRICALHFNCNLFDANFNKDILPPLGRTGNNI